MIRYRFVPPVISLVLGLILAQAALAGAPTDQLKPAVDRVIKTLEDPGLRGVHGGAGVRGQIGASASRPASGRSRSSSAGPSPTFKPS